MEAIKLKKGFKRGPDGFVYDIGNLKAAIDIQHVWRGLPFNGFIDGDPRYPSQSEECATAYRRARYGLISHNEFDSNPHVQEYKKRIATHDIVRAQYRRYLNDINFFDKELLTIHLCALSYISGKRHLKICAVRPYVYTKTSSINDYLRDKIHDLMKQHMCLRHHESEYGVNSVNYYKHKSNNHTCTKYCFDKIKCKECSNTIGLTRGGLCTYSLTLEDNKEIAKDILKKYQVDDLDKVVDNYER